MSGFPGFLKLSRGPAPFFDRGASGGSGPGPLPHLSVSSWPTAPVDPITNTRGPGLEDLLVPLLSPPAEREERQPNAALIILASSRVCEPQPR